MLPCHFKLFNAAQRLRWASKDCSLSMIFEVVTLNAIHWFIPSLNNSCKIFFLRNFPYSPLREKSYKGYLLKQITSKTLERVQLSFKDRINQCIGAQGHIKVSFERRWITLNVLGIPTLFRSLNSSIRLWNILFYSKKTKVTLEAWPSGLVATVRSLPPRNNVSFTWNMFLYSE